MIKLLRLRESYPAYGIRLALEGNFGWELRIYIGKCKFIIWRGAT